MYYASKVDGFLGYPKNTVFTYAGYTQTGEDTYTSVVAALPCEGTTYGRTEHDIEPKVFEENVTELNNNHPLFLDMLSDVTRHDLMKDGNDTIYTCFGWVLVMGDRPMLEVHELDEPNMMWLEPTVLDPMEVNRFSKENTTPEEMLSIQLANFGGLPEPKR